MLVEELVHYINHIQYDTLPPYVISKAIACVQDAAGVFVGGKELEESKNLFASLVDDTNRTVAPHDLALWIGSATRLLDFDDGERRSMGHPGVPIISAALALSKYNTITGGEFIEAIVKGYEVYCFLGEKINPTAYLQNGFDATSVCGAVAASAVSASLLKLNYRQTVNALSIAASLTGGLNQYAIDGGSPKYLCAGWGAHLGILSAQLAKNNLKGPSGILEGAKGYFQAFASNEVTTDSSDLNDHKYRIMNVYFKRFACVRRLHAALDLVEKIVKTNQLCINDIHFINITGSRFIYESAIYNPVDITTAQTSMPYTIALLLLFHQVTSKLLHQNLCNDNVEQLSKKIIIKESDDFNKLLNTEKGTWGAVSVEIVLNNGTSFRECLKYALGEPENPMPLDMQKGKFVTLASETLQKGGNISSVELFEQINQVTLSSNVYLSFVQYLI